MPQSTPIMRSPRYEPFQYPPQRLPSPPASPTRPVLRPSAGPGGLRYPRAAPSPASRPISALSRAEQLFPAHFTCPQMMINGAGAAPPIAWGWADVGKEEEEEGGRMGSPSPAAPPDHAAPPIQLLGNSLGRSRPPLIQTALPGVGTCPGNSHGNGMHPHAQIGVALRGHGPSLPPPLPALLLPGEEFSLGKIIHRLRTALMTQRFCWPRFLRRLPGEARGRPNLIPSHGNPAQPPAPASLPSVFPPLFWKGGLGP